jgi:hypothetical protein
MYNMVNNINFKIIPLNYLCVPKVAFSRVQTGYNNTKISQSMRYSQIVNSTNLRGQRRTVVGVDRIPLNMRPQPAVIVPLTNYPQ